MPKTDETTPPFDIFTISEDVRDRFGWSNDDLNRAMGQLMPAALNGFQHFGGAVPGFSNFMGQSAPSNPFVYNPFAGGTNMFQNPTNAGLTPFFGPEAVQQAVAAQIAGLTGLQSDAIQEMMPVAATLALGQVARSFVQGEARNLLDAYMRGFSRGRPKPQPTPVDYLQSYTDAMQTFWSAFANPTGANSNMPENESEPEPEIADEEPEEEVPDDNGSEFEDMVSGWMDAGRDFQSNQFKAFDHFFQKAAEDSGIK
ncbi:MAG: hypothetical protein ABJL55_14205 [Roseibium sp.]